MPNLEKVILLYDTGRFNEAIEGGEALLKTQPESISIYNMLAAAHSKMRNFERAAECYAHALKLQPDSADAHNNMGTALWRVGRVDDAIGSFTRALEINANSGEAHNGLGNALLRQGRREEAIDCYRRALAINPGLAAAHRDMGLALGDLKRSDEAIASFLRAVEIDPAFVDAHNDLGTILVQFGRANEAITCYSRALSIDPAFADAHHNMGLTLKGLGYSEEASPCFATAAQIRSGSTVDFAKALNDLGLILCRLGKNEEASRCFAKAVQIRPEFVEGHHNLAVTMVRLGRHNEAIECFTDTLKLQPDHAYALAQRMFQKAWICDWDGLDADRDLLPSLGVSGGVVLPFSLLSIEDSPLRHRIRAERYASEKFGQALRWDDPPRARPKRLRIGYFSGDFCNHPVMHLIARLFETHDRTRFEVHAFSYGPEANDAMRARVKRGVDQFHDVRTMLKRDVAALARREAIDIAVDLTGYTVYSSALFAHRPAPIQINYWGYPGTLGAPFIDYIIADKIVIPEEYQKYYSEKIIYLPHSYLPSDNTRPISDRALSRSEVGLPEDGFVFCCFNNTCKIKRAEFDIWMQLLHKVEGSVLWLIETNRWAKENLRQEAQRHGVEPDRLVFAKRVPQSEHLARHRLADLFLDTFNYNAHTTGSDALWSGLPIVTKLGQGFTARVGGSLLSAIGLPELIASSVTEYAARALELATNPEKLRDIRQKLEANQRSAPLFNSELFTKHIETAYEKAYQRYSEGLEPDLIVVEA